MAPLDLEAGSIVWSIKRLRGYLWGTNVRFFSDHKALESLDKIAEHNPRVQRWLEFLTAHNSTLEYTAKAVPMGTPIFSLACLCLRRSSTSVVSAALLRPTNNVSSSSVRTAYFLADPPLCVSVWVGWRPPARALAWVGSRSPLTISKIFTNTGPERGLTTSMLIWRIRCLCSP